MSPAIVRCHCGRVHIIGMASGGCREPEPELEQDPHSGLWYILGPDGQRLHGPYQEPPR